MQDNYIFKTEDLVLKVNKTYDHSTLKLDDWDEFIDYLSNNRYFQSESIKNALIYFASGKYNSVEDLAKDNYEKNSVLQEKYDTEENFINSFQLRKKLSCSIDLATGTGKSYVIFGIAQIMLGLGLVDKVLVLCPSTTIEAGLTEKFTELLGNSKLQDLVPDSAVIKNPHLTNGNYSIKTGDICVENMSAEKRKDFIQ